MKLALCLAMTGVLLPLATMAEEPDFPFPLRLKDGFRLHTGWKLKPAGKQLELDTLPIAVRPIGDGSRAVILHAGYRPPSLRVIDTRTGAELSRAALSDAFLGLALTTASDRVYVGGGMRNVVIEFSLDEGKLQQLRTLAATTAQEGDHFIGDVALTPDGNQIWAADLYGDSIAVLDRATGKLLRTFQTGRRPYRVLFSPDGKRAFTTSWTDGSLQEHDPLTGKILQTLAIGPHATDMAWLHSESEGKVRKRIFVTASNTNSVFVVSPERPGQMRIVEQINVALTTRQPVGSTPSAISFRADGKQMYVTCSDANAVAVVSVGEVSSRVLGFVPTGWYPTAALALSDGGLLVLNGKGNRTYANPKGPQPSRSAAKMTQAEREAVEYVARIQTGTASLIPSFSEADITEYTKTVVANSPYRDALLENAGRPANNPVPASLGQRSPIRHVLYIVKENRTYDQVLGDMREGNGDASLTLFGEKITPNHHKLAHEFVLLDNFYVNADVSADGHQWSSAAISPDFVSKVWPNRYAGRGQHSNYYGQSAPVRRGEETSLPPGGYIWEKMDAAGVSLRNYGYFTTLSKDPKPGEPQIATAQSELLENATNLRFRGYDLDYPDVDRAKVFVEELRQFEQKGELPGFMMMRLGNDHTQGVRAGKIAPESMVADNDTALGMIVEALSKSRFWKELAIFVLEDDAQNGPDHIDSHRSPAFVISPWTRSRGRDSTGYNTASMLRTMGLILGAGPLTVFDAGAKPMYSCFRTKPDTRPYDAAPAAIPLDKRNPENTSLAARSELMDFSEADRIDDAEMNEILWRAIRGTEPPPAMARYVRVD